MELVEDRRHVGIVTQFRGVAIATPRVQNVHGRSWAKPRRRIGCRPPRATALEPLVRDAGRLDALPGGAVLVPEYPGGGDPVQPLSGAPAGGA
jgi:hypothetical protein